MKCDCDYGCKVCTGQAAFQVERKKTKKKLNLCTRCTLSGDKFLARFYQEEEVNRFAALDAGHPPDNPVGELMDTLLNTMGGMQTLLTLHLDLPLAKEAVQ